MKYFRKFTSNNVQNNYSFNFRKRRIELFDKLLNNIDIEKIEIVDIGGSSLFWDYWKNVITAENNITLININNEHIQGYKGIQGDATKLSFIKNNKFDVVFSNSMIEHLFEFENQKKFAEEIRRISKFYFIQTPAFVFPLEPHFLFPFFHWFPKKLRLLLHQKFNLGWYQKKIDYQKAKKQIEEIRIMKKKELKSMFPNGKIIVEKFLFFPKSYIITNMKN